MELWKVYDIDNNNNDRQKVKYFTTDGQRHGEEHVIKKAWHAQTVSSEELKINWPFKWNKPWRLSAMDSHGFGVGTVPPVLFLKLEKGWRKSYTYILKRYTWLASTGGFPEIKYSSIMNLTIVMLKSKNLAIKYHT